MGLNPSAESTVLMASLKIHHASARALRRENPGYVYDDADPCQISSWPVAVRVKMVMWLTCGWYSGPTDMLANVHLSS